MPDLIPFSFESRDIRVVSDDSGEPWFVAKDVMLALEYSDTSNITKAVNHVPEEWKGREPIPTPGGTQQMAVLAEQGLYFFIARSDKPKALPFQKWIAGEVIPSIRKTGGYSVGMPQDYPSALRALADEAERRQQIECELAASRPKIAFHDQVTRDTDILIDMDQAFSLLRRRTGQTFTRATFLAFLRRHGVAKKPNLYANIGRDRFAPRKDYIGTWFESELTPTKGVEWKLRPMAVSEIVRLIETERTGAAMVAGYLTASGAA